MLMDSFTICPETFRINFVLYQNDSLYQEFNWRENPNNIRVTPANESNFELIDTTGLSAVMQIRSKSDLTADPVLELISGDQIQFLGKVSPNIIISISHSDIASITPAVYTYDMIVTDGTGRHFTLFAGDFTVKENITQVA